MDTPDLEILAINDLMSIDNAAYLLCHDSTLEKYKNEMIPSGDHLQQVIKYFIYC
jgi:glyceraldehyde 3-phosphate dehydrogenase